MNDSTKRGPVRRGALGTKPKIVIPLAVLAEITETTNYQVVIERYKKKIKNPKTAIRAKCVECSGGSLKEVQECRISSCALYPFRMGENPFHLKTIKRLAAEGEDDSDDDVDDAE